MMIVSAPFFISFYDLQTVMSQMGVGGGGTFTVFDLPPTTPIWDEGGELPALSKVL